MIGIYRIISPTGKVYIGQSNNIARRKRDYSNGVGYENQRKLSNSFSKHGWINHIFEVVELCNEDMLNEYERYWQEHHDCITHGLNCRLTATTDKSGSLSVETKHLISAAMIGKPKSEEARKKQSLTRTGKPGYKFTTEQRQQISDRQRGKTRSAEMITKMSNSLKGRKPNNTKKVFNKTTRDIYTDVLDASIKLGITYSRLYNMLSGRTKNTLNVEYQ